MTHPWSVTIAMLLTAVTLASAETPQRKAMQVRVRPAEAEQARVTMLKSMPPQFRVTLTREMPTAGFTFDVDAVEVDAAAHRIVARVTRHAPEGMAAQVLTPTPLHLALGTLDPGRYFLEVWMRDDADATHRPDQALVLDAE